MMRYRDLRYRDHVGQMRRGSWRLLGVAGIGATVVVASVVGAALVAGADRSDPVPTTSTPMGSSPGEAPLAIPTLETPADAIARVRTFRGWNLSGDETAEVQTTSMERLRQALPGHFNGLWSAVPGDRTIFVVYLHGREGQFVPPRGRPTYEAPPVGGDTLIAVLDSEGRLGALHPANDVKASEGLLAGWAPPD